MSKCPLILYTIVCVAALSTPPTALGAQKPATATTAEQRLGQAILGTRIDEQEVVWLDGKNGRFLGLYRADSSGTPRGGALILPPLNAHPDWPGVIHDLRTALPRFGWATLAVQLPRLDDDGELLSDYDRTLPEIGQRIETAIRFFNSKGIANIVLIGKGIGACAGAGYMADTPGARVQAFVGISMRGYGKGTDSWLYCPNSLKRLRLPVLDIYGGRDYRDVVRSVGARSRAARQASLDSANSPGISAFQHSATAESAQTRRAGYIAYRQISLAGADGHYNGSVKQLVKRVVGWLKHHAGGITLGRR